MVGNSTVRVRSYFAVATVFFIVGASLAHFEQIRIPGFVFVALGCAFVGFAVDARTDRATAGSSTDGSAAAVGGDHDGAADGGGDGDGGGGGGGD
jgi:hypothetical protein